MDSQEEQQYTHPLYNSPLEKWAVFFLVSMGVLTITYGAFLLVDFLPEKPADGASVIAVDNYTSQEESSESAKQEITENTPVASTANNGSAKTVQTETIARDALPVAIVFDSLDNKKVTILNPASNNVDDLNNALLKGVVRYPGSADFDKEGTIFLFGHSSYLPTVINKNFQAFNGIQNLKWGDTVRLQSTDAEYVYRVDRVYQVKAADTEVSVEWGTPKLVLATCNVFGSKDDRYVVEATQVESHKLE